MVLVTKQRANFCDAPHMLLKMEFSSAVSCNRVSLWIRLCRMTAIRPRMPGWQMLYVHCQVYWGYHPGHSAVPSIGKPAEGCRQPRQVRREQNCGAVSIQRELRDHLVQPLHIAKELRPESTVVLAEESHGWAYICPIQRWGLKLGSSACTIKIGYLSCPNTPGDFQNFIWLFTL